MSFESYRYCWVKVTNEDSRAESLREALGLQQSLMERAREVKAGTVEALALAQELNMARTYLGQDVDHGVQVVIVAGQKAAVQVLACAPEVEAANGIDITLADMPPHFTQGEAKAWIDTPVGATWSKGALACRLIYAVCSSEQERAMVTPATNTVNAARHA